MGTIDFWLFGILFRDDEIYEIFELLNDLEVISLLQYEPFIGRFVEIGLKLEAKTKNDLLKHGLRKLRDYNCTEISSREAYRSITKIINI